MLSASDEKLYITGYKRRDGKLVWRGYTVENGEWVFKASADSIGWLRDFADSRGYDGILIGGGPNESARFPGGPDVAENAACDG